MKSKKILSVVLASALCIGTAFACVGMTACKGKDKENGGTTNPPGGTTNPPEGGTPEQDTSVKFNGKIYVVGDSTVCAFNDNYYIPRYGYGTQLYNYINCDQNQIVNLAISGRSSKSFLTEANYSTLTSSISAGDYLIIGFGHNDEKSDEPARFTDPAGAYDQPTTAKGDSFQYILNEKYVKVAKEKGATPILCTPIVRYDEKGAYTGSVVHNTSDGDYAAAIKTLGQATGTTVVDLTTITKNIYSADNAGAAKFHAYTSYTLEGTNKTPSGMDKTHINKYGAKTVAYRFSQEIKNSDCGLKNNVKTNVSAPDKVGDYASSINEDYVKPSYTAFNPAEYANRKLTGDWYKTVLGNIGGKKASSFTIGYDSEKFTVGNPGGNNGKFDGNGDGFGAVFMQIDAKKNFTASAEVKVTAVGTDKPNQSGFGMMLRDDIYIDGVPADTYTGKEIITSNYVTAGAMGDGSAVLFSRENATLKKPGNSTAVTAGAVYNVSIERIGQTVNVTFGTFKQTFTDFDFIAVDNDYMYLCLFANRGLTCEFSNVRFEITGESQGA